jgi:acetyl-CoA C-acetyltransferase
VREAVIVSTARTSIGKAYRGTLSDISGPHLAAHAPTAALDRADIADREIDDVILGCAMQEGTTGYNVARQAALRAGLPAAVPGMTVDRQCGSGLMAIATAAKQIIADGMAITVGGGVESISLVQNAHQNTYRAHGPWLADHGRSIYTSMLDTAENVAERYGISREAQDAFALASQQRTAAAQQNGLFAGEIVPFAGTRPGGRLRRSNAGTTQIGLTHPDRCREAVRQHHHQPHAAVTAIRRHHRHPPASQRMPRIRELDLGRKPVEAP